MSALARLIVVVGLLFCPAAAFSWPFEVPPTTFPGVTCWYTLGPSPEPDGNPEGYPLLQVDHRQLHSRSGDDRWTPANRFSEWPGDSFQNASRSGKILEVRYWWQWTGGMPAELDQLGPEGKPIYHDLGTRLCT